MTDSAVYKCIQTSPLYQRFILNHINQINTTRSILFGYLSSIKAKGNVVYSTCIYFQIFQEVDSSNRHNLNTDLNYLSAHCVFDQCVYPFVTWSIRTVVMVLCLFCT